MSGKFTGAGRHRPDPQSSLSPLRLGRIEINDEDTSKRLCFSVYEYERNQMRLQGCLSFGIRNTIAKQRVRSVQLTDKRDSNVRLLKIAGWFELLPEDIGEFRHKQVRHADIQRRTV